MPIGKALLKTASHSVWWYFLVRIHPLYFLFSDYMYFIWFMTRYLFFDMLYLILTWDESGFCVFFIIEWVKRSMLSLKRYYVGADWKSLWIILWKLLKFSVCKSCVFTYIKLKILLDRIFISFWNIYILDINNFCGIMFILLLLGFKSNIGLGSSSWCLGKTQILSMVIILSFDLKHFFIFET